MAIIKCKMCGGSLEVQEGTTVCECEYCGSKQTIPAVNDNGLQTLFNRANMLRIKAEFDKASELYEKILQKEGTAAEAYWGLILCKYGIEYVEDPDTYMRVPTCHRASYDAVAADEDYKNALKYAEIGQRAIYEDEARKIDEIQKGILAIAQNEEAYDVFICYKETDTVGRRTLDSVIANDIYHQLMQEGFKVFYAAISLEDKLGTEYEPYIFSALNTAKVMLVIGTTPEFFNATWVKNEWSRFLKIMRKDRNKLLIPCYRDMDPYDLPEEFAHLQAQDMSKIGFITDIVRGIKKVVTKDVPNSSESVIAQGFGYSKNEDTQIKRGFIALEDNEWQTAEDFFETALNVNAESSEAYLGKLLVKWKMTNWEVFCENQLRQYSKGNPVKMDACPEASEHIKEMVGEYYIKGYLEENMIRRLYVFDRTYTADLPHRQLQKRDWEKRIGTERLLIRARQYAQGENKNQIENGLKRISDVLEQLIKEAELNDAAKVEKIKAAYSEHINNADDNVKVLYNRAYNTREKKYEEIMQAFDVAKDVSSYKKILRNISILNGYKECDVIAIKCQENIDLISKPIRDELECKKKEKSKLSEEYLKTNARIIENTAKSLNITLELEKIIRERHFFKSKRQKELEKEHERLHEETKLLNSQVQELSRQVDLLSKEMGQSFFLWD